MNTLITRSAAFLILSLPLIAVAQPVSKDGITLEAVQSGNSIELLLSFEPERLEASALSFNIELPASASGVNTSSCLKDLPDEFSGGCRYHENMVKVIIYSPVNEPIGPVLLGSISLALNGQPGINNPMRSREGRLELQSSEMESSGRRAILAPQNQGFTIQNVDLGIPGR